MFSRKKQIMFLASIALNVILISALAIYFLFAVILLPHEPPQRDWLEFYFEELNISEEQWEELRPLVESYRENWTKKCMEITHYRRELLTRLEHNQPIDELLNRVVEGQREMQEIVLNHIDSQRPILTDEQERRYFEILRRHTSCR